MRLAAPESVLTVLGIQTSSGSLAAAGAALDATFPDIESYLDTTLLAGRRTDYFDLTSSDRVAPCLRLSCSFVSKDEPIIVSYSSDGAPLTPDNAATLDPSAYHIDYTLGIVYATSTFAATRRSLAVTYSAGFDADVSDSTSLSGLPDTLVQGAISKAASYMMLNPANVAKDKARFMATVTVHGLELKGVQAIRQYTRPRGTVIWHSFSETIE